MDDPEFLRQGTEVRNELLVQYHDSTGTGL